MYITRKHCALITRNSGKSEFSAISAVNDYGILCQSSAITAAISRSFTANHCGLFLTGVRRWSMS